ncbi:MAG: MmcQ/YjbR family DNA-binding protein [Thermoanaerobaculia bacterium]|nr:MmcQ/YjbR family DNA-binding protein [Thermoanaerobaculia bacterium]
MTVLDRVRGICLGFPGAYEKVAWSAPTFRVGDRQFAMFADDHHGVGFAGVWLKAPEGAQEELVGSDPGRFYVPPYVGTAGWVGVRLDGKTDWKLLAGLLAEAYRGAAATQSAARIARGPAAAKARPKPGRKRR